MKVSILESATFRGSPDLIGNGACAQQCEFSKLRNTESPGKLTKFTQKIAYWRVAEYQIKLLKFACKYPAALAKALAGTKHLGSVRGGLSASISAEEQPSSAGTAPPTALYSVELGRGRGTGKVVISMAMAAVFGHFT